MNNINPKRKYDCFRSNEFSEAVEAIFDRKMSELMAAKPTKPPKNAPKKAENEENEV